MIYRDFLHLLPDGRFLNHRYNADSRHLRRQRDPLKGLFEGRKRYMLFQDSKQHLFPNLP